MDPKLLSMEQLRRQQTLTSSSWKKIELESRSTSFPAVIQSRRQLFKPASPKEFRDDNSQVAEDESVQSWAKAFHCLAQSTLSVSSPSKHIGCDLNNRMIDIEPSPSSPQRTPVLIMTLIKLYDVFETFCSHLKDATYSNVQKACMVLDSTIVAVSPIHSEPSSPAAIVGSPSSYRSSSPRSPITSWLMGTYDSQSCSQTREFEKFCNPLIIFAGLEAIYSACTHMESNDQAHNLTKLYEKSIEDLRWIREILCDPFVSSAVQESSTRDGMNSSYQEKARILADSIEAIMLLCEIRCNLIEQQRKMCSTEIVDVDKMIGSFRLVLQNAITAENSKATRLVQSAVQDVDLWCNLLKTYSSLGKLGFLDTIICCQKIKLGLNLSSNTCIQKWMCKVFQSFVSISSIYFDSFSSDIIGQYGFLPSSFPEKPGEDRFGPNLDLEAKLEEFLRLHDRNGTSLAVAVVVDISDLRSLRSKPETYPLVIARERSSKSKQFLYESSDIFSSFPAIYLASSMQNNLPSRLLANRRISTRKETDSDTMLENDLNNGLISSREMDFWPYTSWNNLIPLLRSTTSPLSMKPDSVGNHWSQIDSETMAFVSWISESIWFVAMEKTADENRWSRRNSEEYPKKEHQFLVDLSNSLRLRKAFESCLEVRHLELNSPTIALGNILSQGRILDDDYRLVELLQKKLGFGSQTNKFSFRKGKQNLTESPKHLKGISNLVSDNRSHFAFFLGSTLMNYISK